MYVNLLIISTVTLFNFADSIDSIDIDKYLCIGKVHFQIAKLIQKILQNSAQGTLSYGNFYKNSFGVLNLLSKLLLGLNADTTHMWCLLEVNWPPFG